MFAMSALSEWMADAVERMDSRLPAGFYAAVSVPSEPFRDALRRRGRAFIDPEAAQAPPDGDVDATARWVIAQAGVSSAGLAAVAATLGAASVPPEVVAQALAVLRTAQRLAIVYGFDPETERGALAVWRAVAAVYGVSLPSEGPADVRVRDLGALLLPAPLRDRDVKAAGMVVARAALRKSASMLMRRAVRWLPVPLLSPGLSALQARRKQVEVGEQLRVALRDAAGLDARGPVTDAVEL
jgi:hypothetical protein